MSVKSTKVVSTRIFEPFLWMRQISDGSMRDTNGTTSQINKNLTSH
jgi:hypothetical protein